MKECELVAAMEKGRRDVISFAMRLETRYKRQVLAAKKFPFTSEFSFVSANKTHWMVFLTAEDRNSLIKKGNFKLSYTAVMNTDHGYYAIEKTENNENKRLYNIFPPHFFSRYAERLNIPERGLELISRFVRDVKDVGSFIDFRTGKIVGSCETGLMFGEHTSLGNNIFKTFIRKDKALSSVQQRLIALCEQVRNEETPAPFSGDDYVAEYLSKMGKKPPMVKSNKHQPYPTDFVLGDSERFPSLFNNVQIQVPAHNPNPNAHKSKEAFFPKSNRLRIGSNSRSEQHQSSCSDVPIFNAEQVESSISR